MPASRTAVSKYFSSLAGEVIRETATYIYIYSATKTFRESWSGRSQDTDINYALIQRIGSTFSLPFNFLSQANSKVACLKLLPVGLNLLFSSLTSLPPFPLFHMFVIYVSTYPCHPFLWIARLFNIVLLLLLLLLDLLRSC